MFSDGLLQRLAVALAIGLLVGLERGWQARDEGEGERAAGFRTFALSGLLGGICAALVPLAGALVLAAGLLAFTLVFAVFHWLEAQANRNLSATGVIAGILTFALGAYAVLGEVRVAVAAAVASVGLLALKQPLHAWLRRLTWPEIRAGLVLLAMSFLLLPLLPDRPIDPWGALNPAEIWLLAIIIAALSFVGYVAVRVMGARAGIMLTALTGGLASSTAVTLTLARLSKGRGAGASVLAGGILLAGAVMIGRVLAITFALNQALVVPLAWPLGTAIVVFLVSGGFLLRRGGGEDRPTLALQNPLELGIAFKLAAIIALIMLLAKIVGDRFGDTGLYMVAAVSGIADVDALTLSMARLGGGGASLTAAATAIGIAVAVNTAVKCMMAIVLGSASLGIQVVVASIAAIAAGSIVHFLA